ncbi:MAG TPA: hypothetical protein VMF90_25280 [Rhizobiaceae bacterium]|nr:hypothetical protein [Rhizobiaceae bacterium]
MHKFLPALFTAFVVLPASAQPAIDLPALIECRADPQDWGQLAFSLMGDPSSIEALGWAVVASQNPFLQEYALTDDLSVFGHTTRSIALTSTGPMAIFDRIAPEDLATALGVTTTPASPGQFLGEKVIADATDENNGMKIRTRVALNVSTVESHPGKVLAGCSYLIEMVDG